MTMARGTPILPGQVSLFRDGTFVGNGRLPLLSPGEEHELGFGVDDAVRVTPRHRRGEARRDRHHHVLEDRHAQLSHHRQEPARAARSR